MYLVETFLGIFLHYQSCTVGVQESRAGKAEGLEMVEDKPEGEE